MKLDLLRKQGEEARREQDPLGIDDGADRNMYNELASCFTSELWIKDAISA